MGTGHMEELTTEACWDLLAQHKFGRLAYVLDGEVNIVPINHAVVDGQIAFETGQGSKLLGIDEQVTVAYEIDDITASQGTSVVVRGFVVALDGEEAQVAQQGVQPWIGTPKVDVMAIVASSVTGRRYTYARD